MGPAEGVWLRWSTNIENFWYDLMNTVMWRVPTNNVLLKWLIGWWEPSKGTNFRQTGSILLNDNYIFTLQAPPSLYIYALFGWKEYHLFRGFYFFFYFFNCQFPSYYLKNYQNYTSNVVQKILTFKQLTYSFVQTKKKLNV